MTADWRLQANCRNTPDAMFPENDEHPLSSYRLAQAYNYARRVCISCDVRTQCLEYALANREPEGMWGAMTPRERSTLRKASRKAAA